jgi:hypothetical protein
MRCTRREHDQPAQPLAIGILLRRGDRNIALATEGVIDPIGGQQFIDGVQVPAVDDVVVEPPHRLLVVLDWHGPSLERVSDLRPVLAARPARRHDPRP